MSDRSAMRARRPARGYTLLELMIVVIVISILSMVAYNSYQGSVRKGRRADIQGILLQHQASLERFYTNNNTYAGYLTGAGAMDDARISQYYNITFGTGGEATTATSYVLVATPKGAQLSDGCGVLKITNAGVKTSAAGSNCWQ